MKEITLNQVRMNVISTASNGVVNEDTIFEFTQKENAISATYAGGKIRAGFLVGLLADNKIQFSFCQLQVDGRLDNGISNCVISETQEGKIRLTEYFEWSSRDGEAGVNVFQEL